MKDTLQVRAQNQPWRKGINIAIFDDISNAEPVVMRTLTENEKYCEVPPALTITNTQAQTLMDDLWHCGIRPTEGTGSAGSLKATQDHLSDMKEIANKTLDALLNSKA
jgi:hypothetical protein